MAFAPVPVLGMHRSGTTLVAELLAGMGVRMGRRRMTVLAEPPEVVRLHEWLLRRAGGSWEYPLALDALLVNPDAREDAARLIARMARRLARGAAPWGFKDPRTAFTFELWDEAVGPLRPIVVRRDPRDVAASLAARARTETGGRRRVLSSRRLRTRLAALVRGEPAQRVYTVRSWRPDEGLGLWCEYNRRIDGALAATGAEHHELRFEDLLADPLSAVTALAEFVGVDAPGAAARRALHSAPIHDPAVRAELMPSPAALEQARPLLERYRYSV